MGAFEDIADRRIRAGQEAGLFDGLAGQGRPIPDLGRIRPPGWWATRLAGRERSKLRAEDLRDELALAMPSLWREPTEADVVARIRALNQRIDDHNAGSTWEPVDRLDPAVLLGEWRRLARYRTTADATDG